jgi:hypothetical protein
MKAVRVCLAVAAGLCAIVSLITTDTRLGHRLTCAAVIFCAIEMVLANLGA